MRPRLIALALATVLSLTGGGAATAASASAAPGAGGTPSAVGIRIVPAMLAPTARVTPGDRMLTVAWPKVAEATGYIVEVSTSSGFSNPKRVQTTRLDAAVKYLKNGTRYYVRVLALPPAGGRKTVSKAIAATPASGYPRELTVTVVPAGADKVKVSWTGQSRATKVAVLAGSEGSVTKHPFQSSWYPATTKSIVLTVPGKYRNVLGTGTGNPIFVKVATYNSLTAGTSMPRTKNEGAAYRLSPAGSYTWPSAVTPTGTKLRVGTWNVNSVAATKSWPGYTWRDRRTRVATAISASGAAIVATQELTTADTGSGKSQWEDLRDLLAQPTYGGYAMANPEVGPAGPGGTKGAHIFFKPGVATRLDGGIVSAKSITSSWPSGLTDRFFSWAKFQHIATGKTFVVVSAHLPSGDTTALSDLRIREARAIDAYVSARASGAPVILMGDLNSSFAESPAGAQRTFFDLGYRDAASALKVSGVRYSTANITGQIDNTAVRGYPFTAYKYKYAAPRIDYIFVKNGGGAWAFLNRLVLVDGKFVRAQQGSDHNMQVADIGLP
jgi:endonuclease/exonuclease/phosphatase family metal-dependent hydrolase